MNRLFKLAAAIVLGGFCSTGSNLRADLIEFENGDQLRGKVMLVNETEIKLQSEALGLITLSRAKVASITFRSVTNRVAQPEIRKSSTNAPSAGILEQLRSGIDPNTVEQVQNEFLGTASPEASAMFNEMLGGLASGKLNLGDIRNQAESSLKELKALQKELDEEDNPLLGTYVGILEKFINQTSSTNSTNSANRIVPPKQKKPVEAPDEE